ncbi:cutinase transcription factor 1 alpha, putative [Talaromyces stipitatus ATCC 10500]|uniref:Cutinase transcription factor 1 alpha, putative n=1 Tax=Talaromyces stipitatus (strain ATCC 10500 / CBS 375.48 / QM 6759 / NRRL 1006) TaxID=441959 RepID=B8M876_TALSN|nr:cutinase transcription factor 1 alpha, putative [Talaromyces stipitatus ATCC 10500]EED20389.1 cutinase transcription factor 1 alpha, putative [Talaromyces stipitatus ATCC 10500]
MSPKSQVQRTVRTRAKRACITCNARRVKCNVVEKQPCDNCRASGAHCEIGVSRRGKYPRYIVSPHPSTLHTSPQAGEGVKNIVNRPRIQGDILSPDNSVHLNSMTFEPSHPRIKSELDQTIFFGESSPLTCVVEEGNNPLEGGDSATPSNKIRWQYPIPEVVCRRSVSFSLFASRKARKIEQLTREGIFDFPEPAVCEMLLKAYFEWFHPCFPIVDRVEISKSCNDNTISPLLLQSMLFIGASLCSDEVLRASGFSDRYETKFHFYDRGKEIFDADCETDSLSKLQALFLLSFWRSTPGHEKDTRYWLGAAISLAQTGGLHMLSKLSLLKPKEKRVRKRIFWSLYIRDQQVAAAYGLPPRIRDEDCDISMLDEEDFDESGFVGNTAVFGIQRPEHISYMIQMARASRLLREVVWAAYLPGRLRYDPSDREKLKGRLLQFESELPPELKLSQALEHGTMYFAGIVNITYHYLYILLYRPSYLDPSDEKNQKEGMLALQAACRCTRILEDMLSHNLIEHGIIHLITNIFATLCIHTVHFSRSENTERKLAEHRAKLCLLGLKELQKSWDLNYWVLEIFFHCLDESTAEYLKISEEKNNNNKAGVASTSMNGGSGNVDAITAGNISPSREVPHNMQLFPSSTKSIFSSVISVEEFPQNQLPSLSSAQQQEAQQQEETLNEEQPQNLTEMTPLSLPSNEVDIDLSEPYLFDEEFARNFGSCTPRLDALNSTNLDFLYRYL